MKVTFEGTDVELLALKAIFTDALPFTKEMLMSALKDAMDGLRADLKKFVDDHNQVDDSLRADLADAVKAHQDAVDALTQTKQVDQTTIDSLNAANAQLQADINTALQDAADLRAQINPPAVAAPTTGGGAGSTSGSGTTTSTADPTATGGASGGGTPAP